MKSSEVLVVSGLNLLKHAALRVLYEARDSDLIPQRKVRDQLGIRPIEGYPEGANQLTYGILAHLGADGHAIHHLGIGWKITEEGIEVIEGSI